MSILVRLNEYVLNTASASARAPGFVCDMVKVMRDLYFAFLIVLVDCCCCRCEKESRRPSFGFRVLFLTTKKRVVLLPGSSSMFSARQTRLCFWPASFDPMAAVRPLVDSRATSCAAADVLPTSTRSTCVGGKCVDRKRVHWPQTCGCVYSVRMEDLQLARVLASEVLDVGEAGEMNRQ